MSCYVLASLLPAAMHPDIVAYLEGFDATLAPFGGRYLIHGGRKTALEGTWPGDVVMLEFPDRAAAEGWYASPAYRALLPLRTRHLAGDVVMVDGVPAGHRATDILSP